MASIKLSKVELGYGLMSFVRGREHVPATVVREGNVTTHTAEIEGQSDAFDVSFQISFNVVSGDHSQFNVFSLRMPLAGKQPGTPYSELEFEAVQTLAPLLRSLADEIESKVTDKEGDDDSARPAEG